ncbi:DUF4179 domain-containing protein [Paenibacillus flagellatus]|nr:DUF4179 domain-containing protein [Paenibacillus flagellatus]
MNEVEHWLHEEKTRTRELAAPEDMEARLRAALSNAAPKTRAWRSRMSGWRIAAAVFAVLLVSGNQYHALAYYGKTLLGFDRVVDGTLGKLNQEGRGQAVGEQVELADGSLLTVDGLMSDENQLILYYTRSGLTGLEEEGRNGFIPIGVKGFRTDSAMQTGSWGPSKDRTEIKGIVTFEPVSPLAKKLTLSFWDDTAKGEPRREGRLTFSYRPDEAMPTRIKQTLHRTVAMDDSSIVFGSITATPTMTLVEGTIPKENRALFDQVLNGAEIVANGNPVTRHRGDISLNPSHNGYTFALRYDPLPDNLTSVQIVLKDMGETIDIPMK